MKYITTLILALSNIYTIALSQSVSECKVAGGLVQLRTHLHGTEVGEELWFMPSQGTAILFWERTPKSTYWVRDHEIPTHRSESDLIMIHAIKEADKIGVLLDEGNTPVMVRASLNNTFPVETNHGTSSDVYGFGSLHISLRSPDELVAEWYPPGDTPDPNKPTKTIRFEPNHQVYVDGKKLVLSHHDSITGFDDLSKTYTIICFSSDGRWINGVKVRDSSNTPIALSDEDYKAYTGETRDHSSPEEIEQVDSNSVKQSSDSYVNSNVRSVYFLILIVLLSICTLLAMRHRSRTNKTKN